MNYLAEPNGLTVSLLAVSLAYIVWFRMVERRERREARRRERAEQIARTVSER